VAVVRISSCICCFHADSKVDRSCTDLIGHLSKDRQPSVSFLELQSHVGGTSGRACQIADNGQPAPEMSNHTTPSPTRVVVPKRPLQHGGPAREIWRWESYRRPPRLGLSTRRSRECAAFAGHAAGKRLLVRYITRAREASFLVFVPSSCYTARRLLPSASLARALLATVVGQGDVRLWRIRFSRTDCRVRPGAIRRTEMHSYASLRCDCR
jgi:hypothetical protein